MSNPPARNVRGRSGHKIVVSSRHPKKTTSHRCSCFPRCGGRSCSRKASWPSWSKRPPKPTRQPAAGAAAKSDTMTTDAKHKLSAARDMGKFPPASSERPIHRTRICRLPQICLLSAEIFGHGAAGRCPKALRMNQDHITDQQRCP